MEELGKFEENPMIRKTKSLEIMQFFKDGPDEFATIFRVELRGSLRLRDCLLDLAFDRDFADDPRCDG